jgi:hypothetical protein
MNKNTFILIFTFLLLSNVADLFASDNNIGTLSKLNGQCFALDSNNLSGFSFGVALELSLDLAKIVNE